MSGGKWDYLDDRLATEIFGYWISTSSLLDEKYNHSIKEVIRNNPLEDYEMSAIVFDVLCVLHAYDWAISGDTEMEYYRREVKAFKNKWLKSSERDRAKSIIDTCITNLKEALYETFCTERSVADDIKEGLQQAIYIEKSENGGNK